MTKGSEWVIDLQPEIQPDPVACDTASWWYRYLKETGELIHPLPNGMPGGSRLGDGFAYATPYMLENGCVRRWVVVSDMTSMEVSDRMVRDDESKSYWEKEAKKFQTRR